MNFDKTLAQTAPADATSRKLNRTRAFKMRIAYDSKPVSSRAARSLWRYPARNIVITAVRIVVILPNAFLRPQNRGGRTSYRRAEVLNGASLLWVIDTDECTYQVQDRAHVHRKEIVDGNVYSLSPGAFIIVTRSSEWVIANLHYVYLYPSRCAKLFHVSTILALGVIA